MKDPFDNPPEHFLSVRYLIKLLYVNFRPEISSCPEPCHYFRIQVLGTLALAAYTALGWRWPPLVLWISVIYLPFFVAGAFIGTKKNRLRHLSGFIAILALGVLFFRYPGGIFDASTASTYVSRGDKSGLAIMLFCSPVLLVPFYLLTFWLSRYRFKS